MTSLLRHPVLRLQHHEILTCWPILTCLRHSGLHKLTLAQMELCTAADVNQQVQRKKSQATLKRIKSTFVPLQPCLNTYCVSCARRCECAFRTWVHVQRARGVKDRPNPSTAQGFVGETWDMVCRSSLDSSLEADERKKMKMKNKTTKVSVYLSRLSDFTTQCRGWVVNCGF